MNDRFKFRAWDKVEQRWLEDSSFTMDGDGGLYWRNAHEEDPIEKPEDIVIVRSTGLLDKNGVLIYEGDIVAECTVGSIIWDDTGRVIERPTGVAEYRPPYTTLSRNKKGKVVLLENKKFLGNAGDTIDLNLTFYDGLYQWPKDVEIIGNIYENPDLIPKDGE